MTETRRDRFLKRISSVGGGTRDAIQMLMGSIVLDLRDFVERGILKADEGAPAGKASSEGGAS